VESWPDAEKAIDFLRKGGRASYLPALDTVRPSSRIEVPRDDGVVGVAVDLVHAEERLMPVAEMLLVGAS